MTELTKFYTYTTTKELLTKEEMTLLIKYVINFCNFHMNERDKYYSHFFGIKCNVGFIRKVWNIEFNIIENEYKFRFCTDKGNAYMASYNIDFDRIFICN